MYFDSSFDRTVDVIVVGYGDAGAVTAMTAHDEGAEVLIVEKQREDGRRPNSRFSGGMFINPNDVDAAAHYMRQLYEQGGDLYETDPAVIRRWAESTSTNAAWLQEQGGAVVKLMDLGEHAHLEGVESISIYKPDMGDHPNGSGHRGWGWGLFQFLTQKVADRGVEVMYGASAQRLLTDASGAVTGVRVEADGNVTDIGAARGVVLTLGGFEFNERAKLNYLKLYPTHFYGNPENTGDGLPLVMDVGADLWHMNACSGRLVARFPGEYPGGCPVDIWGVEDGSLERMRVLQGQEGMDQIAAESVAEDHTVPVADNLRVSSTGLALPGAIFTDRSGRRFTNEEYKVHALYYELASYDSQTTSYPRVPAWWFFDERRRSQSAITAKYFGPTGPLDEIPFSDDNLPEIEKGWIRKADSVAELADLCGLDRDTLERTFSRYNEHCQEGTDPDYGRSVHTLTPLDSPPYYAVQMWPGGPNTQGGARRDPDGAVVGVSGKPISGLYSAGEFGSVYGMLYPSGGGSIAECLAFGRIAGNSVAADRR
jgi:succinate dehydrogenase/fumarate reductase flavoprotein subunit